MNVLVTGAAGFIGSHLVEAYLRRGDRVVGIDNELTGDVRNVSAALGNSGFSYLRADVVSEFNAVIAQVEQMHGRVDLILHFASPASPVDYERHAIDTLLVNSRGTENCVAAAMRWNARFLYASTSESYGDPLEHPQRETYWGHVNPVGPRSCYDEAKRYGEAYVSTFVRKYPLDARIIRIFNTYGPRMRSNDGRVVPNFIMQALRGEPLTVYGGGEQTRSFCYVSDLVRGIVACADSDAARGRVVNLGNPEEHTIGEFARIVAEMVGVPLATDSRPMPPDDPSRRCPDITVARELLGWEPAVGLRDGLRLTIDAFRSEASVRAG